MLTDIGSGPASWASSTAPTVAAVRYPSAPGWWSPMSAWIQSGWSCSTASGTSHRPSRTSVVARSLIAVMICGAWRATVSPTSARRPARSSASTNVFSWWACITARWSDPSIVAAARRLNAAATIEGSDQRAVMQAHQLKTFVEAELRAGRRADVGLTVARQAPQIITAISERATTEVREGRWLVPDAVEHDQPLWIQADMGDHQPAALGYLTAAAVGAVELAQLAGPDPLPVNIADARLQPPRETLAQAVAARMNVTRPDEPAARLAPPTGVQPEQQVHL